MTAYLPSVRRFFDSADAPLRMTNLEPVRFDDLLNQADNYYTRELMNEGDNPPIGIVLCADKSDAIVKYTLPENNNQIFASKYFTSATSSTM